MDPDFIEPGFMDSNWKNLGDRLPGQAVRIGPPFRPFYPENAPSPRPVLTAFPNNLDERLAVAL